MKANRFDFLNQDKKDEKEHKTKEKKPKENDKPKEHDKQKKVDNIKVSNNFVNNEKEKEKEKEKEIKGEKKLIVDELSFPELIKTNDLNNTKNKDGEKISFLDKLKTEVKEEDIKDYIEPGWTEVKLDKSTNKRTFKKGNSIKKVYEKSIDEVVDDLVELYERRKYEYINTWGIEEYEKVFKFPNHDYNYFDKLDEQYEEEFIQELESEIVQELEDDYY